MPAGADFLVLAGYMRFGALVRAGLPRSSSWRWCVLYNAKQRARRRYTEDVTRRRKMWPRVGRVVTSEAHGSAVSSDWLGRGVISIAW